MISEPVNSRKLEKEWNYFVKNLSCGISGMKSNGTIKVIRQPQEHEASALPPGLVLESTSNPESSKWLWPQIFMHKIQVIRFGSKSNRWGKTITREPLFVVSEPKPFEWNKETVQLRRVASRD